MAPVAVVTGKKLSQCGYSESKRNTSDSYECLRDVLKGGGLNVLGSMHKWNLFSKQTANWKTVAGRSLVHVTSSGKRVQVCLMKITTVKHWQIQRT